jgi:hypothetical protein
MATRNVMETDGMSNCGMLGQIPTRFPTELLNTGWEKTVSIC